EFFRGTADRNQAEPHGQLWPCDPTGKCNGSDQSDDRDDPRKRPQAQHDKSKLIESNPRLEIAGPRTVPRSRGTHATRLIDREIARPNGRSMRVSMTRETGITTCYHQR